MAIEKNQQDYSLFLKFIDRYCLEGFSTIKESDPLMLELEEQMAINDQFFYLGDLLKLKILYASKRSLDMIGVPSKNFDAQTFINKIHPDERSRLFKGRAKFTQISEELMALKKKHILFSANFRSQNNSGGYSNLLHQSFFFYCEVNKSVYLLKIHTNIDWYIKNKNGFQFYIGEDLSYFNYPTEELLGKGNLFSNCEFEIIKLIDQGLSTKEIAQKLFISIFTVNTHRRNIINKTEKSKISEIIKEIKEYGFL